MKTNQIYFTADLHFGHANILKHSPNRPFSDTVDIAAHDEWLLDLWRSTVDRRDTVYILGDLTFLKSEEARHLLEKLPGNKFLVEGNHDGSIRAYKNYFKEVYQIKEMRFKTTVAPFLKEDFKVVMCHYHMVTWNQKPRGSVMLHGHSHDYQNTVESVVNYIIDTELPKYRGVEIGNTRRIKALLKMLSQMVPYEVDISKLSTTIGIQRLTTLKYLKYLEEASLIHQLFTEMSTITDLQKPNKILLDNSNLLYTLSDKQPEIGTVRETFLCNQLHSAGHRVEYGGMKSGDVTDTNNKQAKILLTLLIFNNLIAQLFLRESQYSSSWKIKGSSWKLTSYKHYV